MQGARWIGSPKFSSRQGRPILVIVNHIMDGTLVGTDSWFNNTTDPRAQGSAHYGVGKLGQIHQYVKVTDAAWHAGRANAPSVELPLPGVNPNLYTIGIEWEGRPGDIITEAQFDAGLQLHQWLLEEVVEKTLPLHRRVIGHSQVNSVSRPRCPGPSFPWARLYEALEGRQVEGPRALISLKGVEIEVPIVLLQGRSHVQLRDTFEKLGLNVSWDQATETATVK